MNTETSTTNNDKEHSWTDIGVSLVWGFGIALLFRKICKNGECIVVKEPNPKQVRDKVFKENDHCFKLMPEETPCNK